MDEKQIEKKEQEETVVEKKAYTPPALTVYGKLTELTAGGTQGHGEPTDPLDKNYKKLKP